MIFSDWPWRHWRQVRGEAIALRLNDEQLNWRELCARVDELATGFAAQGVVEGSGVMLRAWNTPQTLLAWLALLQCGARVLPVNPQLPQPLLEELLPNLTLQFALVPDGENTFPALTSLHIQLVEGAHAAAWQPTRLCSMTLTSGSTGLPKAAVHTYQAHLASAQGVLSLIPFGEHDDWLLSLPLFHVSGQGIMWRWLYAGARMTVRDKQPLEQMLAGLLYYLHQQPRFGWRITLLPLLELYWQQSDPARRTVGWLRRLKRLRKAREPRPLRLSPLHMDVHAGNLVHSASGLKLIDWEYAGDGDIALELAAVWVENTDQHRQLVNDYATRAKIYPAQLWRQVRRWFPWLLMLKAGWFEYRWRQTGDQQFIRLADDTWRQLLIKQ